ncbi:hypothetical protein GGR51DRAFT_578535 [Nemania sp. FL0031]|nr:hypothetical protein GGR51DRAFT_578535 [Nemania sp. FL0031]
MEQGNQDSTTGNSARTKAKSRRTPLKQTPIARSVAPSPSMPVRRRRKRIGGKRTVRSCTSCRAAHVRCVADRYGIPCERCAKKSWMDCTLMQQQQEQAPTTTPSDQNDRLEVTEIADTASLVDNADSINASEIIDITDTPDPTDTSNTTDTTETTDATEIIDITDTTDDTTTINIIDPGSSHAQVLKQIASDALELKTQGVTPEPSEPLQEPPQEAPGCTTQ